MTCDDLHHLPTLPGRALVISISAAYLILWIYCWSTR